jgi:hypothetical protein
MSVGSTPLRLNRMVKDNSIQFKLNQIGNDEGVSRLPYRHA